MPREGDTNINMNRIAHEPSQDFVKSTNVWEFMQTYDVNDYDELIERTTSDVPGEPSPASTGSGT